MNGTPCATTPRGRISRSVAAMAVEGCRWRPILFQGSRGPELRRKIQTVLVL